MREQLGVFIDAAKHRDEALDHMLLAGPPGLGKCVTTDTMVFTTHGMEPISQLGHVGGESWQPITRPIAGLYGTRTADYFYDNGEGPDAACDHTQRLPRRGHAEPSVARPWR